MESSFFIEKIYRSSYGKLLSILMSKRIDIATAEDLLSRAFIKAIDISTTQKMPENLEAWLLKVAINNYIDIYRKNVRTENYLKGQEEEIDKINEQEIPDERLKLMFICCHPKVDVNERTALILQTVLGLKSEEIARSFLVKPKTMAQRLVRTKQKIRDEMIPFEIPDRSELPGRIQNVLEAVYAIYTKGRDELSFIDQNNNELVEESIYLCKILTTLLPGDPELKGLFSLILHSEARKNNSSSKKFVPLFDQDASKWNVEQIFEADRMLAEAYKMNLPNRFQYEAVIQSMHNRRAWSQPVSDYELMAIYEQLLKYAPTISNYLSLLTVKSRLYPPEKIESELASLPAEQTKNYIPYWVLKGHLAKLRGDLDTAKLSYQVVMGLCENENMRSYFFQIIKQL